MTEIPVACTLSHDAIAQRQEELKTLRHRICEKRHISNGFILRFEGSTENLMVIAQVMAQERLCCRFLQFKLLAEPDMGSFWLEVSEPSENTQFLLALFGIDEV
jgi:hypothetical protein